MPVTPAYAKSLAIIHAAAFPPGECWSADVIALQLEVPSAFGLMDERGGMILGWVVADQGEILTLAVAPSAQRQGVGTALLKAAVHEVTQRGARSVFLEVAVSNVAAQALYARVGFRQVGRRQRYYADGTDALVLRADLEGGNPNAARTRC